MKMLKAAALVLAAQFCAGTSSAQTSPGVTVDSIKLGVVGPFSGPASEFSKSQVGSISLLRSVNDAGGSTGASSIS